jgi:hypothetical protein
MKLWLAKFRISAALDSAKPWPHSLQRKADSCDELRRFANQSQVLDSALKQAREDSDLPPALHDSIMRAIRSTSRPGHSHSKSSLWRWVPVPVLGLAALVGISWLMHQPRQHGITSVTQPPPSLAALTSALTIGTEMTQTMPASMMAPMSEELVRVRLDVDNTANFLLASLP